MDFTSKNLTIPRGKVLFAEYRPGTRLPAGKRFVGNCPELTVSRDTNALDHYSSTSGTNTLDASIPLGGDLNINLVTDDIQPENLRYWFMGDRKTVSVTAQSDVTQTLEEVMRNDFYQIGRTETQPLGVGRLVTVAVAAAGSGGSAYVEFEDYEVDYDSGLLYIMPGGAIADESDIVVTYSTTAHTYQEITSGSKSVEGEMTFISDNPYGPNRKLVMPRVRWQPNGDLSFLTDPEAPTWMQLSFNLRCMKKGNLPLVLNADGLPAIGIA